NKPGVILSGAPRRWWWWRRNGGWGVRAARSRRTSRYFCRPAHRRKKLEVLRLRAAPHPPTPSPPFLPHLRRKPRGAPLRMTAGFFFSICTARLLPLEEPARPNLFVPLPPRAAYNHPCCESEHSFLESAARRFVEPADAAAVQCSDL